MTDTGDGLPDVPADPCHPMDERSEDACSEDWDAPLRVPVVPELHLSGFDGPLDLLLDLVERERIDIARISVHDMVDQFVAAMAHLESHVPIERRADWVTLVARLILLRSRLLLPTSPEAERAAVYEAERERGRLQTLGFIRAAAGWLDARPQLGRDVFARGMRERNPRVATYVKLMEALLAVLERVEERSQPAVSQEQVYTPVNHVLFRIPEALLRIRAILQNSTEPMQLTVFLPQLSAMVTERDLVVRSAIASTFFSVLELARTGEMSLGQGHAFEEISCAASHPNCVAGV